MDYNYNILHIYLAFSEDISNSPIFYIKTTNKNIFAIALHFGSQTLNPVSYRKQKEILNHHSSNINPVLGARIPHLIPSII